MGRVGTADVYASLLEQPEYDAEIAARGLRIAASPEDERREFSSSVTEADVFYAYRLLLARFPDAGGFDNLIGTPDLESLVSSMLGSPEFRGTRAYQALGREESKDLRAVDLGGFRLFVSPADLTNRTLLSHGSYEPHVTDAIRRSLRAGSIFCDIGANIGYYANLAASIVGDDGMVFAFEARGENCASIRASLAANGFDNVVVLPFALSDSWGFHRYLRAEGSNGFIDSLVVGRDHDKPPTSAEETVQSMPLDAMAPHFDRIDVIKLDIEGAEARAMMGAKDVLSRYRPLVITELSPDQLVRTSGVSATDYLGLFADLGYQFEVLETDPATVASSPEHVIQCHDRLGGGHTNVLCTPGR